MLRDFSLTLPARGRVLLYGPSGCGKTTLTRLLLGLEKPDSGQILGREGLRFSVQFQEDRLFAHLTALRNIALVAGDPQSPAALLARAGLSDAAEKKPAELSGGMRRRVALLRALAAPAEVYILDEPFKGMDRALREQMLALVEEKTAGGLLLLVGHEREAMPDADLAVDLGEGAK